MTSTNYEFLRDLVVSILVPLPPSWVQILFSAPCSQFLASMWESNLWYHRSVYRNSRLERPDQEIIFISNTAGQLFLWTTSNQPMYGDSLRNSFCTLMRNVNRRHKCAIIFTRLFRRDREPERIATKNP